MACLACLVNPIRRCRKCLEIFCDMLQLDHINGNKKDNRIENLRLLCPNCHSQTDTYAGRNKAKKVSNLKKDCDNVVRLKKIVLQGLA